MRLGFGFQEQHFAVHAAGIASGKAVAAESGFGGGGGGGGAVVLHEALRITSEKLCKVVAVHLVTWPGFLLL